MARRRLTGVLLVGGKSGRFGSPKALARIDGETLAERAWRVLGEACDERLAVGKRADGLELPFPVLDDGLVLRAALAVTTAGPLPAAVARGALPVLERRLQPDELRLQDAFVELRTRVVDADPTELVTVNRPEDLGALRTG